MTLRVTFQLAVLALCGSAGLAHADTYLYSISVGEFMASVPPLGNPQGTVGYFAFFVQVDQTKPGSNIQYSFATPDPTQNGWSARIYDDVVTPGPGPVLVGDGSRWVAFGGTPADTGAPAGSNVTLIGPAGDILAGKQHKDNSPAPIFWGSEKKGTIAGSFPADTTFYFSILTLDTPPAILAMNAFATGIANKDFQTTEFTIHATQATPEPRLFAPIAMVLAIVGLTALWRRRSAPTRTI